MSVAWGSERSGQGKTGAGFQVLGVRKQGAALADVLLQGVGDGNQGTERQATQDRLKGTWSGKNGSRKTTSGRQKNDEGQITGSGGQNMTGEPEDTDQDAGNRRQDADQPVQLPRAPQGRASIQVTCHLSPITPSLLYPCHLSKTAVTVAPRALAAALGGNGPQPDSRDLSRFVRDLVQVVDLPVSDAEYMPEPWEKKGRGHNAGRESTRTAGQYRLDIDRRRAPRAHLELPIRITWRDTDGHRLETEGLTRDVSETGIYFMAPLEVNAEIVMELRVNFPEEVVARTGLEALYLTKTVRKEELDGSVGLTSSGVGMAARFLTVPRVVDLPKTAVRFVPRAEAAAAYANCTHKWH